MSTFSGLSGALSALHSQRRALEVSGQNIANSNTEGYSRQRANLQAVGGNTISAVWSTSTNLNGGVTVESVERLRDGFLESRGRSEHAQQSFLANQTSVYSSLENIFAEPSDTALASQLNDMWAAWGDASNHPEDPATRAALLQRANVVADGLGGAHQALASQWGTYRAQLGAYSQDINATAASVAELNTSILRATNAGLPINEMADQRDLHLMHLAELTGATSSIRGNGTVDVYIGGSTLVSGTHARTVAPAGAARLEDQSPADSARLEWTDTGRPLTASGKVGSALEALTGIIPNLRKNLNDVAAAVVSTVNTQHRTGFGTDGVNNRDFFTGTTAADIKVAFDDPARIGLAATAGTLDGSNGDTISRFGKLANGGDVLYQDMVAKLGVNTQAVGRRADIQNAMTADTDMARASDSGVNLDEEMTNMMASQRAYEAASRVLTTIDSMLDQLINRTGLVGR